MSVEMQRIINRLRSVSAELSDIGVGMQNIAVSASMLERAVELRNMGTMMNRWADQLEEETSGTKVH